MILVGAPRFELGTPSPPDSGSALYGPLFFANVANFGRPAVKGLGTLLQTFQAAIELDDCRVRQLLRARQVDLQDVGDVLERVAGDGCDLRHRAAGLGEHRDCRAAAILTGGSYVVPPPRSWAARLRWRASATLSIPLEPPRI